MLLYYKYLNTESILYQLFIFNIFKLILMLRYNFTYLTYWIFLILKNVKTKLVLKRQSFFKIQSNFTLFYFLHFKFLFYTEWYFLKYFYFLHLFLIFNNTWSFKYISFKKSLFLTEKIV